MIARAIELYRRWISPALHATSGMSGACRFQPTCSEYAAAAYAQHGIGRGSLLSLWRLLRCNPFCRGGFDPVPPSRTRPSNPSAPDLAVCRAGRPRRHLP
ncbi:MAG TPA: membrane protein insertion efficiency factor YidD [Acidobacteriaceae bacterium]|nr:membrane protein insertion efficiency factor YidD [Acidobacteriaceae bacterium]